MAIQTFSDEATRFFFETGRTKKGTGWLGLVNIVARKLDMVHYAAGLSDLRYLHPGIDWKRCMGIWMDITASALTISGELFSSGRMRAL